MKTLIKRISLLFLLPAVAWAVAEAEPALITVAYPDLVSIREELKTGRTELQPAYKKLIADADRSLNVKPPSVMEKGRTPPSGDKHDFYAIGNYSWPNPDTADGMPYVRRDGQRNPGARSKLYDKGTYNTTVTRINTLALAYFYTGDERYAAKAADFLRTWFIEPSTRMNPNLNFSAAHPGVHDGHYIGIIEGVVLIEMLDYVNLLTLSDSWTAADNQGLKAWFSAFTTWLLESEFGRKEIAMRNNHGTWYAAQVAAYSIYTGEPDRVKRMIELGKDHLDEQLAPDGSMPAELTRTRSLMYSRYGLRAFATLARCGDLVGEDLWRHQLADGRGLEKAFHFIAPYLNGSKEWTWPRIGDSADYAASIQLIRWPARIYRTPALLEVSKSLDPLENKELIEAFSPAEKESRVIWLLGRNPR